MEVPLVEHGSLMLRASQRSALQPNIALVARFAERVSQDALQAEAERLATSPFRLGRRLRPPRIPGARPRWYVTPSPPTPETSADTPLEEWLDEQMSVSHDPQHGAGWRLSALHPTGGGTVVTLGLNHLFGTGRDLVTALYGGLPLPDLGALPAGRPWLTDEALDVAHRLWSGTRGTARLAKEVACYPWRREPYGDLASLGLVADALRDRDPSRGRRSRRRVAAVATLDAAAWDHQAAEAGGTSTSLQVAIAANLARSARIARGGDPDRPVRIIVPVDLADRDEVPDVTATVGPIRLTSATVVLPGGRPGRGDLSGVRATTRQAFGEAALQVKATGRVPVAPGLVDTMNLLPDDVTRRAVFAVHGHYDAAASNVGPLPDGILRLGDHVATDAALMAFPLGSDVSVALARHGGVVQLGIVADPSRLGGGPTLRDRLTEELKCWRLPNGVW